PCFPWPAQPALQVQATLEALITGRDRLRPDLAPALITHLSRDDAPAAHYALDGHVAIGAVRYELALADQFVNARDAHARLTAHLHHGGFRIISPVVAHQAGFRL